MPTLEPIRCSLSDIDSLVRNPAWTTFLHYITEAQSMSMCKLISCDLEDVPTLRGEINAFSRIATYMDDLRDHLINQLEGEEDDDDE